MLKLTCSYLKFGSGANDRKLAKGAQRYLYLERKNGKTIISGSKNIKIKIGEKLSIIRKNKNDTFAYGYRLLISDGFDYYKQYTAVATKTGKYTWYLEPDAYGEQQKITITVTK